MPGKWSISDPCGGWGCPVWHQETVEQVDAGEWMRKWAKPPSGWVVLFTTLETPTDWTQPRILRENQPPEPFPVPFAASIHHSQTPVTTRHFIAMCGPGQAGLLWPCHEQVWGVRGGEALHHKTRDRHLVDEMSGCSAKPTLLLPSQVWTNTPRGGHLSWQRSRSVWFLFPHQLSVISMEKKLYVTFWRPSFFPLK